jgi:GT2 family glycosyltransferase
MRHLKQEQYVTVDGFAATANLAVHRDVADALQFRGDVRSGGDADFCLRAKDAGHQLVYTGDATVEHPARQTTRDVLTKVHRICKGIESNPDRWADRVVPRPRARLYVARLGYQQGYSRSPIWMLRGVILDWWCERLVYRSAARTRTAARRG